MGLTYTSGASIAILQGAFRLVQAGRDLIYLAISMVISFSIGASALLVSFLI
jgi:hypothetical protein